MAGLIEAFNQVPDGSMMAVPYDVKSIANWIGERYVGASASTTDDVARRDERPGATGERYIGAAGDVISKTWEGERRRKARERLALYEDRGAPHFEAMLARVFADAKVRDDRLKVLPYARFQNVTRRIAWELAMVYKAPAKRSVSGGNEGYQEFIKGTGLDTELREGTRYIGFLNNVFLSLRVVTRLGKQVPVVDVVTPDAFAAVPHPLDRKELVAVILDRKPTVIVERETDPHYVLWSEDFRVFLNSSGRYISHIPNPYGLIPGVLAHRRKPRECLLDQDSGQDIIDAHYAVCLLNVMMLFGQKTGTKAPYAIGDMSRTARGQSLDQDKLTQFEEGVAPGVLDLGHDPASLIASAKSTIAQVGANYGIPEDVFNLTHSPTSGYDRRLKRWGLEERREEQVPLWREYERELAEKASKVMSRDADAAYRFQPEGWQIDFGEVEAPQEPMERLNWREKARTLGLRTTHDDIAEDNPDLDEDGVEERFQNVITERAAEVELQRALNMPKDPGSPGQTPQQNGAQGPQQQGPQQAPPETPQASPQEQEAAA